MPHGAFGRITANVCGLAMATKRWHCAVAVACAKPLLYAGTVD